MDVREKSVAPRKNGTGVRPAPADSPPGDLLHQRHPRLQVRIHQCKQAQAVRARLVEDGATERGRLLERAFVKAVPAPVHTRDVAVKQRRGKISRFNARNNSGNCSVCGYSETFGLPLLHHFKIRPVNGIKRDNGLGVDMVI